MHSKWRYEICISVFRHSRGTWVFSKLWGIQNYSPKNFRCNLKIKLQKIVGSSLSTVRWVSKIVHEWNGHLEFFSQVIENSRKNLLLLTDINIFLQKTVVRCPWLVRTVKNNNRPNCSTLFCTFPCCWFAWLQCQMSRNFLIFTFYRGNVVHVCFCSLFPLPLIFFFSSAIKFASVRWS